MASLKVSPFNDGFAALLLSVPFFEILHFVQDDGRERQQGYGLRSLGMAFEKLIPIACLRWNSLPPWATQVAEPFRLLVR